MADRDVMEFDVDAWRADEGLTLLRPASRDFWHEVILVMWKSGQRGELSGSINDLARLCRCSPTEARAAIDEIKARHVGDVTEGHGIVTLTNRRMKRAFEIRANACQRQRKKRSKNRDEPDSGETVTPAVTVPVTASAGGSVTGRSSPAPGSPPRTPSYTPTLSPGRDAAHPPPAEPSGSESENAEVQESQPPKGRKVTDAQLRVKEQFDEWWINHGFPQIHDGVRYPAYDSADGAAVWKLLKSREVAWDIEQAKAVAMFYLRQPEMYGQIGHRLRDLGHRLGQHLTKFQQEKARHGQQQYRPSTGANAFAGARRSLPVAGGRATSG